MMISQKMNDALNDQINAEQYSSHLYLAMAAAFEKMNLKVFAQRFYMQAEEETTHAMKFFKYIVDQGGDVCLKQINAPEGKFDSVKDIITEARDHEIKVTKMINSLAELAEKEKDYATRSFLQWFIDEQVEEVASMEELLALVEMAGPKQMLYLESRLYRMMQK
ncbi:MAG: ferritin [Armatimonadota bacterium]